MIPTAYVSAVARPSAWFDAARSHMATMAKRMTAYPATTRPDWPVANRSGVPAASMSEPAMIVKVSSR